MCFCNIMCRSERKQTLFRHPLRSYFSYIILNKIIYFIMVYEYVIIIYHYQIIEVQFQGRIF